MANVNAEMQDVVAQNHELITSERFQLIFFPHYLSERTILAQFFFKI